MAQAQSSPKIEWEVYNRFRFYKDPQIFRDYLAAASEAAAKSARGAHPESAKGAPPGRWALDTEDALQAKPQYELRGWAATNFLKPQAFCWSVGSLRYTNCGSEVDYILPKSIAILAQVTGDPSRASGTCVWALETPDGAKKAIQGDCAGVTIDVPYTGDNIKASKLCIAAKPNATDCAADIAPVEVKIRDYLIVGMGDSFGAGVGNPDIPAQMDPDGRNAFSYYTIYGLPSDHSPIDDPPRYYLPVRQDLAGRAGGQGQAQWLDTRCFRSQYGPQFRAALQLATALKHNSVTYVDLACNGATVLQGLLTPKPLDPGFAANVPPVEAQLVAAARIVCDRPATAWETKVKLQSTFRSAECGEGVLCEYTNKRTLNFTLLQHASRLNFDRNRNQAPLQKIILHGCGQDGYRRPIDYLLLSIGGNDIGFASLVAQEALPTQTLDAEVLRELLQYTFGLIEDGAAAEVRLGFLPHIYARLNEAFAKLMPIRGQDLSRVLLAAYPLPDGGTGSMLCGETAASAGRADNTMDGLNVLGGFANNGAPDADKVKMLRMFIKPHASSMFNEPSGWPKPLAD
ncbi:MAG TPA: hypothetical protein VF886_05845 [Roseiarcus sp.]